MSAGTLAAASGVLESSKSSQHPVSIVLYNTDTGNETITLEFTPSGGTKGTFFSITLATGESLLVNGLPLGPGDTINGYATSASKVNYFVLPCPQNVPFSIQTFDASGGFKQVNSQSAVAGALTCTTTSANAIAAGPSGTSNPTFKVNANASSCVTGWSVTGAAVTGGAALAVISSGTNEPGTIDAKGSGVLNLAGTSTGQVYLSRGALKALVVGCTLTDLGTTQSSTPTSAQLLGGFMKQTGATGAGAVTLPTGTALSTAMGLTQATGDSFRCMFLSVTGGQTLTITGATGTTVRGTAAVPAAKTAQLDFINTGSNTWDIWVTLSA